MRKIKLLLFSLLALGTTQAQTLSYKHSNAGSGYSNVTAQIDGYLTTSQQNVVANFHSNIVDYNNNWTGNANYNYYVNNTFVGSSTNPNLSVDISAYIPVTSVRIVSNAGNWSAVEVTLTVTPTVALTAGPTVSNVSYYKYTAASPLTATLTGSNVSLKWYTSSLGEGYSSTPPTPSTATVGTTTYYVSQANSSGVESARSMITVTINPVPAPNISYSTPQLYTVGTAIANLAPTNTGGAVPGTGSYVYSVSPALPAGLSIDATTGVISGTPTEIKAATNYTITAVNEGGSSSAVVNIRVKVQAPNISYSTPQLYTVGTAIANLAPTNTGGAVPGTSTYIYSVSPALPTGLSMNATTGVISGTPTQVSAATNYNITATNESGSSSAVVNIRVKVQAPNISYSTPQLYTVGTAIANLVPANTGGAVPGTSTYIYSVSPALPSGLSINATTGVISGTPTQVSAATNYNITATNESGSSSAVVNIRVKVQAPNISYTSTQLYTVATAIANLVPTNTGGAVPGTSTYIYSISPALPSGLSINATTGVISGTPTQVSAATNYNITATNESGSSSAVVNIRVKVQAPNISYTSPQLYTVATAIANLVPANTGGAVPGTSTYIYSVSPALPAGLSINATTGVISGTPTQVSAATDYNITATNESGSSTAVVNIRVKIQAPDISYTTPQVYIVGTTIASLMPTNTGGAVPGTSTYIYSITPSLPAGLNLDAATGEITGTPTQLSEATNYSITASNESGTSSATVNIKVTSFEPYINYNTPQVYTIGTEMANLIPTNLGGPVPPNGSYVSTFAGGAFGNQNGIGTTASFSFPFGLATDADDNVYVADQYNHSIRKITPEANVTTLAGNGIAIAVDSTGTDAGFNTPMGVAVDNAGNVFVADQYSNKIRKITQAGVTTTLAGTGFQGIDNGIGQAASFSQPIAVALSNDGNTLFVADYINNVIRKVTSTAEVTTFSGSGAQGADDGIATEASFNGATGLVADALGNVFVADQANNKIRKITAAGVVSTFAGSGSEGAADGQGTAASFNSPTGIAIDGAGNLYVADQYNFRIRKITPTGLVSTIAGNGTDGFVNGLGFDASFSSPTGIAVDSRGDLYVTDLFNNAIRKITQLGYSIQPALPAGLIFNTATGEISGTPTETRAAMNYTITATNQYGRNTTILRLSVEGLLSSTKNATTDAVRIYTTVGQKIGIAGIEKAHVTIYNQLGQQVYNAKVTGIIEQSFAKGIYIVQVGTTVSKVLIK